MKHNLLSCALLVAMSFLGLAVAGSTLASEPVMPDEVEIGSQFIVIGMVKEVAQETCKTETVFEQTGEECFRKYMILIEEVLKGDLRAGENISVEIRSKPSPFDGVTSLPSAFHATFEIGQRVGLALHKPPEGVYAPFGFAHSTDPEYIRRVAKSAIVRLNVKIMRNVVITSIIVGVLVTIFIFRRRITRYRKLILGITLLIIIGMLIIVKIIGGLLLAKI